MPLAIQHLVAPRQNKGGDKLESYECGELPEGSAWVKFNIRFYVIALILFILPNIAFSEDESIYDTLQRLQNDIKTLERAVYSDQSNNSNNTQNELDQNSEDVLTRHLLKLTENMHNNDYCLYLKGLAAN